MLMNLFSNMHFKGITLYPSQNVKYYSKLLKIPNLPKNIWVSNLQVKVIRGVQLPNRIFKSIFFKNKAQRIGQIEQIYEGPGPRRID